MVHLKYVDNLFTEKNMLDISKFCDEKSFYDCINRKFLDDDSFKNLESTFHMYFFTGDSCENIGYVQLYNNDLVDNYFYIAYEKVMVLLEQFKTNFSDIYSQDMVSNLKKIIFPNEKDGNYRLVVEEVTLFLKKISVLSLIDYIKDELNNQTNYNKLNEFKKVIAESYNHYEYGMVLDKLFSLLNNSNINAFQKIYDMFSNYLKQTEEYLSTFPTYFYLDVVIALPKEEEFYFQKESKISKLDINKLVELKYYGFIYEALVRVTDEINKNFSNIPIFLENGYDFSISNGILIDEIKQKIKKIEN